MEIFSNKKHEHRLQSNSDMRLIRGFDLERRLAEDTESGAHSKAVETSKFQQRRQGLREGEGVEMDERGGRPMRQGST
ncbi:hypothetical protein HZH68_000900 [Vespula germanica]|uniref:Uncharacterized protein n=1 Tax=Vespula germanica TaxID=30212 RepID=A0A834U6G8_VESGE|nr:hypothetical protein HZH68_000900 [Vespula germanica]